MHRLPRLVHHKVHFALPVVFLVDNNFHVAVFDIVVLPVNRYV